MCIVISYFTSLRQTLDSFLRYFLFFLTKFQFLFELINPNNIFELPRKVGLYQKYKYSTDILQTFFFFEEHLQNQILIANYLQRMAILYL